MLNETFSVIFKHSDPVGLLGVPTCFERFAYQNWTNPLFVKWPLDSLEPMQSSAISFNFRCCSRYCASPAAESVN